MINYWPRRTVVQGIKESLAKKVKSRLEKDLGKIEPEPAQVITIHRPRVGVGHWANRGFEEYKNAA